MDTPKKEKLIIDLDLLNDIDVYDEFDCLGAVL
jgi:hypothetical protein